jgi:hypothetical protein
MHRTLSDTHRVVLANAAAKASLNALPVPSSIGKDPEKISKVLAELLEDGLLAEVPAGEADPACGYSGASNGLLITNRGLSAIGISPVGDEGVSLTELKPDGVAPPAAGSKLQTLVRLLQRPEGAVIDELVLATGWQKHSVRGAMSGALKKKHNHQISSVMTEGRRRVYRIEMTDPHDIVRTTDDEAQL